jgi:hypothetical protein
MGLRAHSPVAVEVELFAKCKTESEDKVLNFGVFAYRRLHSFEAPPSTTRHAFCKRSELSFQLHYLQIPLNCLQKTAWLHE